MEHVEEAGIHSGDSAVLSSDGTITADLLLQIKETTKALALELNVIGLLNIQFAIKDSELFIIEVNPHQQELCLCFKNNRYILARKCGKSNAGKKLKELGLVEMKKIS
jgi:carbamoyl-phosphate synthase large subunit